MLVSVDAPDLVDRLTEHKTLGNAPREELAWLVAHGTLRQLAEGDVLSAKGVPVSGLFIILTGRLAIDVDRGAGRHRLMGWRGGEVTGMLPYSRLVSPPGDSVALEPSEILAIPREDLPALIHECPEVTSLLVHVMLDRSRHFTSAGLQDEKMISLGKLSAGLAHELNNPVSAIERGAALLEDRLEDAERATRALGATRLTEEQLAAIDAVRVSCLSTRPHDVLTPLQQAEREDEIADWLAAHGVESDVAGPLADTAVTIAALERIARAVSGPPLAAALRSVAAGYAVRQIASEIQEAATRISGLVLAIKGFTHMDQATVAEPVDLKTSLGNTVAVLNSKARSKSAAVTITAEPDLPRVRGFAGELNQIWANLIDNALDAVPNAGHVDISAQRDRQQVVVRVVDNGPGIPTEIAQRIFDPFFTTKPVGKGTGLGLDIVRRLANHNDAQIEVESIPGRTEFRVSLPIADAESVKGAE
jgi:signal transduction histidine kinase